MTTPATVKEGRARDNCSLQHKFRFLRRQRSEYTIEHRAMFDPRCASMAESLARLAALNCAEARVVIEIQRRDCYYVRPLSTLKDLIPIEFKTRYDSVD